MWQRERYQDLGFGSSASQQQGRLLNQDGSFNVERRGLAYFSTSNWYNLLITMSWPRFTSLVVLFYVSVNVFFALCYLAVGIDQLHGVESHSLGGNFLDAFFFSTQTLTTVGYGHISPNVIGANIISSIESMTGLLSMALVTGLLYGRFSRPTAELIFSDKAIIAPYQDIRSFQFRLANRRKNQLIDVEASVYLTRLEREDGKLIRKFHELELERKRVTFLHLSWTVVHPIDESSPLFGVTKESLDASDAEFLILIRGFDDTFSQSVHARSSYKHHEVEVNAKFSRIIGISDNGRAMVELDRISEFEKLPDTPSRELLTSKGNFDVAKTLPRNST